MPYSQERTPFLVELLLTFAQKNELLQKEDVAFARNQLLALLDIPEPDLEAMNSNSLEVPSTATPILDGLLDYALKQGIIPEDTVTYRDLFDTKIMGIITPKPSEIIRKFNLLKEEKGIKAATDAFYHFCQKSDYIRTDRIAKNVKWEYSSPYGTMEITINLTKPEKDPREIAALKNAPQVGYPKCLLCPENVGYAGRINHPARQNLRTIPIRLGEETWHLQFSPYVYYNQHCIVLYEEHVPMKINRRTFSHLLDFLRDFPHYFIGSNADIPIVGGSILNHDHFQGGFHVLPMERAAVEYYLESDEYPDVEIGVLHWPISVLRINSKEKKALVDLADHILKSWRDYSDPTTDILAYSMEENGEKIPHNSITPIARINSRGQFELDLALRNNRTSSQHPMGIFHPHNELHHIKKENIGLIEVMGLFILPGRLLDELNALKLYLTGQNSLEPDDIPCNDHPLAKHIPWLNELIDKYGSEMNEEQADEILRKAVGEKCIEVLHHAGVFKTTMEGRTAFDRFLKTIGIKRK